MHLELPHKFTKEKAVENIKEMLTKHRAELAAHATFNEERWDNSTLYFEVDLQGKEITGTLETTDSNYIVDAKLPLMWRMFEGKIEAEVKKQVEQMSKD